jgi:hypothetical protein
MGLGWGGVNTKIYVDRTFLYVYRLQMDERNTLMLAVRERAFAARISLYALAAEAKVSGTSITRWIKHLRGDETGNVPSLATIGKLEKALNAMEQSI